MLSACEKGRKAHLSDTLPTWTCLHSQNDRFLAKKGVNKGSRAPSAGLQEARPPSETFLLYFFPPLSLLLLLEF